MLGARHEQTMVPGCASQLIAVHGHCHHTAIQKMIIGRRILEQ
jgi:hypothetical protein